MCFKKAVAKSSGFSRIFAFGLMIFSGAGLINLCTVCAEATDELQGPPVAQSHIIGIDPGHQGPNVDMSDLEPLGPGSTEMKAKASTGTQGTFSGLPEYQLNLDVSLKLQQILENRGYQTVLTRTDNDTAISNKERAEYVAGQGAEVYVRIHANGAESSLELRLKAALKYARENEDTTLILSGGQGFGEDITEAKCMENYLTAHGISQERLVLEEKSTSTKENLKFSDELTGCSKKNTGILSNNFHVYRAVKLAEKLGYKHPYGIAAVSDPIMQVHYVVREVAALVKEKLRGNI